MEKEEPRRPPCRSPEISEFAFLVSSPCLPLPCLSLRLYMSLSQRSRRAREGKKTQYIPIRITRWKEGRRGGRRLDPILHEAQYSMEEASCAVAMTTSPMASPPLLWWPCTALLSAQPGMSARG